MDLTLSKWIYYETNQADLRILLFMWRFVFEIEFERMYAVGYHLTMIHLRHCTRLLQFSIQQEEGPLKWWRKSYLLCNVRNLHLYCRWWGGLRLADKIQDTQLNMKVRWIRNAFSKVVWPKYCMRHTYIKYSWDMIILKIIHCLSEVQT